MGMPACTITSQTAHGGIVVVGFPTVLIGMMPASRIGDNHVCPMVTGVVPHVGGPFVLGSMTVLVGNMPQSRVTDELVCVGPPDVAVMGVETVLVGMAGAGGAAGAAGGIAALGAAVPMQPPPTSSSSEATVQYDGTTNTSTQASSLPPIPLTQKGWPGLSPENTAAFRSVAPVTLPPGTQLFAAADSQSNAVPNFWSTVPPQGTDPSKDVMKVLTVTDPAGMKAWAGQAASPAQPYVSQTLQMVQQAAAQAQQQVQAAQAGVQQAQQQLDQAAAEGKAAAQKALNQAQQQAQQVQKQVQQAAQQATQQAQQTMLQAQQQARQAAAQAEQQSQQAGGQATQVCTPAESAAKQAIQKFALPKMG
jgi:uncharacterized Zn-binding protein involved in type VI secretion